LATPFAEGYIGSGDERKRVGDPYPASTETAYV
jgi:hypothetical protein